MGDVVELGVVTTLDIPPDKILNGAMGKLSNVVVIGETEDGKDFFAASKSDAQNTVFLLEWAKHRLMKIIDEAT